MQAGICGGFSVICCTSRRGNSGSDYSTLEMGSRRLMEGRASFGAASSIGRDNSTDSAGLIPG